MDVVFDPFAPVADQISYYNSFLYYVQNPPNDLTLLMNLIRYCVANNEIIGLFAFLKPIKRHFSALVMEDKLYIVQTYYALIGPAPLSVEIDMLLRSIVSLEQFDEYCQNFPWGVERMLNYVLTNETAYYNVFHLIDDKYILTLDTPSVFMLYFKYTKYRSKVIMANLNVLTLITPDDAFDIIYTMDMKLTEEAKLACWSILLEIAEKGKIYTMITAYYHIIVHWNIPVSIERVKAALVSDISFDKLTITDLLKMSVVYGVYNMRIPGKMCKACFTITECTSVTLSYELMEELIKTHFVAANYKLMIRMIYTLLRTYAPRDKNLQYYIDHLPATDAVGIESKKNLQNTYDDVLAGKKVSIYVPNSLHKRKRESRSARPRRR